MGEDFTAKDFRTWGGTCLAANFLLKELGEREPENSTAQAAKSALVDVVKNVACKLGNKPATCRKYYIHPAILESFTAGTLHTVAEKYRDSGKNFQYEQMVLSLIRPLKRAAARNTAERRSRTKSKSTSTPSQAA